jgi:NADH-quinone oxidoreductase subunit J
MNTEVLLFWVFSILALSGALGVVLLRDPVKGALSLIACFFCLAGLYLLQAAQLLAVLQVLVYAGAIMVLFVFVIMLVERHDEPILPKNVLRRVAVPVKLGAVALVAVNVLVMLNRTVLGAGQVLPPDFGTARGIGLTFFNDFAFQFELASVLLLVAIVGAVMISRKDRDEKKGA